jgi:hypothetical protein
MPPLPRQPTPAHPFPAAHLSPPASPPLIMAQLRPRPTRQRARSPSRGPAAALPLARTRRRAFSTRCRCSTGPARQLCAVAQPARCAHATAQGAPAAAAVNRPHTPGRPLCIFSKPTVRFFRETTAHDASKKRTARDPCAVLAHHCFASAALFASPNRRPERRRRRAGCLFLAVEVSSPHPLSPSPFSLSPLDGPSLQPGVVARGPAQRTRPCRGLPSGQRAAQLPCARLNSLLSRIAAHSKPDPLTCRPRAPSPRPCAQRTRPHAAQSKLVALAARPAHPPWLARVTESPNPTPPTSLQPAPAVRLPSSCLVTVT